MTKPGRNNNFKVGEFMGEGVLCLNLSHFVLKIMFGTPSYQFDFFMIIRIAKESLCHYYAFDHSTDKVNFHILF